MLIKGWNVAIIEPYILGVIVDIARIRTSSLSLPYFDEHQPFETLHLVTQRHILWRRSRARNRLIHTFEGPINYYRYKIMLENSNCVSCHEGRASRQGEEKKHQSVVGSNTQGTRELRQKFKFSHFAAVHIQISVQVIYMKHWRLKYFEVQVLGLGLLIAFTPWS